MEDIHPQDSSKVGGVGLITFSEKIQKISAVPLSCSKMTANVTSNKPAEVDELSHE